MTTTTLRSLALTLATIALFGGCLETQEVVVKTLTDEGAPVSGAEVQVYSGSIEKFGLTDDRGEFRADVENTNGARVQVGKDGYYSHDVPGLFSGRDHHLELILRDIRSPISLYAKRVEIDFFGLDTEWIGYDFTSGEIVNFESETANILFSFSHEFKGYRSSGEKLERSLELSKEIARKRGAPWSEKEFQRTAGYWHATLDVKFPGEKEGIMLVDTAYQEYSQMRMPHLAPELGYESTFRKEVSNSPDESGFDPDSLDPKGYHSTVYVEDRHGYSIRTGVSLGEEGDIKSACYAKLGGEFHLDPRGRLRFTYYFNPNSDDRNLEFDPERNLFENLESGEEPRR